MSVDVSVTSRPTSAVEARLATGDEIEHYHAFGWVKMERLFSPEVAAQMLVTAKAEILGKDADGETSHSRKVWRDSYNLGRDRKIEPFQTLCRHENMGRNAQAFIRRNTSVAMHVDMLAVKMPAGVGGSAATGYHQDFPNFPLDRNGLLTFWVALEDMTPEQGTMRFYSGSQHEVLGKFNLEADARGILDASPFIEETYPLSPPLTLKAGDCTVHNSLVVHGAPDNITARPRWTYLMCYHPCDARWTGAPHHTFNADAGLTVGEPVSSPKFPVVYQAR